MTNPTAPLPDEYVSWREFLKGTETSALALVCLAVWLHAADSLIVATMLPSIVEEIGGAALVSWSVSIYEIGSIVAGAATALLTMRYGLRFPMALSAGLFGLGCAISAISPTMEFVLLGRALQGIGGGGLVAMAFVALGVLFPRRYTARAMASVSTFWGLSAFLGPLLGGLFVEYASWRIGFGVFAAQAGVLALWIALRRDTTVKQTEPAGRFPVSGFPAQLVMPCGGIDFLCWGPGRVLAHCRVRPCRGVLPDLVSLARWQGRLRQVVAFRPARPAPRSWGHLVDVAVHFDGHHWPACLWPDPDDDGPRHFCVDGGVSGGLFLCGLDLGRRHGQRCA